MKTKPKPDLMERARALKELSPVLSKEQELYGFLSLFHPEMTEERKRKLCRREWK